MSVSPTIATYTSTLMQAIGDVSVATCSIGASLTLLSVLTKRYCGAMHGQNEYFSRVAWFQFIFSSMSLAAMTTSSFMVALSYYAPYPYQAQTCLCHHFFIAAVTCYVIGFYAVKLCFVVHCHLVYQLYINMRFSREEAQSRGEFTWFNSTLPISFAVCLATSLCILTAKFSEGECIGKGENGCRIDWNPMIGYVTLVIIFIDVLLTIALALFVYRKLRGLRASRRQLTRQMGMHALCIFIPFVSSLVDITLQTVSKEKYDSLVFLCVDCLVFMICIFVAFSPAQGYVKGVCCFFVPNVTRIVTSPLMATNVGAAKEQNVKKEGQETEERQREEAESDVTAFDSHVSNIDADTSVQDSLMMEAIDSRSNAKQPNHNAMEEQETGINEQCLQITACPVEPIELSESPPSIPHTPLYTGSSRTKSNSMESMQLSSMPTSATSPGSRGIKCPRCNETLVVGHEEDPLTVLKLHVVAFHFDA